MKKTSIVLLLLVAIIFGACKKEIVQEANKKQLRTMNGTLMTMPTVQNGILTFKDEEQFKAYMALLQEQVSSSDQETDDVLMSIEEQVGFSNSYRQIKADAFDAQNAIGWNKPSEIPDEPFTKVEQSIMNQYKEYKIGDNIYKRMSSQFDIIILGENVTKAEEILAGSRLLQEGNGTISISQIRALDWSKKHLVINDISINGWEITPTIGEDPQPLAQWELSGLVHSMNECGGQLNKAVIRSMVLINTINPYTPLSAYYDVDYGDGSAGYTNYHATGGMFGIELYDEHQYPAAGTYTLTIKARATSNGQIVVTKSYQVTVVGGNLCSNASKTKTYWHEIDATHAIRCKLTYNKRRHWLQGKCADGLGEVTYFVKEGSSWKNKKATALGLSLFSYGYKNDVVPCTLYGATPEQSIWLNNVDDANINRKSCDAGLLRTIQLKWITIEGLFKVTIGSHTHEKRFIMSVCD
ncbi:hypothetical protein DBR32_03340 [Taibaiella sp. KBW10]|uniref:hypothetical protein n=1 Tax=Taibaiella sp. KBW10 TaxID=2153357 RepID=UPI000F5B6498|nr:hypothetical protein [Taibaiella sp. KBW10]RQO32640.1 hypothetical protein DBR32_03340 [Taibaiella sp. KBW10]